MVFEILLLSVIVVTAYLGPVMVRRLPPGNRTYAWMLLADLGLATFSFLARQDHGNRAADLIGVVAIGAGAFLVVVPPILRDIARRWVWRDWLRPALVVIDIRELLQPGLGAAQERELVEAILAVRAGRVDEAIQFLRDTRAALDSPLARRQIDERIVMTYVYARQWTQAIDHYEASIDAQPGPASPNLLVEMVRAYCEARALDKAASLVARLEDSPLAEEPILVYLVNRARMVFLAFAGRTSAVEAILGPTGPLGAMPRAMRAFWSGIARLNAGDRAGARSSLTEAARHTGRDRRSREMVERTLDSIDEPGVVGPHPIPAEAAELADRLTVIATTAPAAPQPRSAPKLAGVGLTAVPATVTIILLNVAAAVGVTLAIGPTGDPGVLVMAGANLKSAVAMGEWWRLPTSMFLHVGIFHLVLNMYGLWVLGRLVEQMLGSVRFLAVYLCAGLVGALASYLVGGPGMSAGASGAVFGVLGAALAELALHRRAYPDRWRRALFGNLVFLTIANVAIGFYYTAIDQSAHIGGLITGGVLAAGLSRAGPFARSLAIRAIAVTLAVLGTAAVGYGGWGVATTRYADTLARYDWGTVQNKNLRWERPVGWDEAEFFEPQLAKGTVDKVLEAGVGQFDSAAKDQGYEQREASDRVMPVPSPWQARELTVSGEGMGGHMDLRVVVFAEQVLPGIVVWGALRVPDRLAADNVPVLDRILASIAPADAPAP